MNENYTVGDLNATELYWPTEANKVELQYTTENISHTTMSSRAVATPSDPSLVFANVTHYQIHVMAAADQQDLSQIAYILVVLGVYMAVIMILICIHMRRRDRYWTLEEDDDRNDHGLKQYRISERLRLLRCHVDAITGIKDAHLIDKVPQDLV